jgi:aldehyde dehydrogenase (NAD+)
MGYIQSGKEQGATVHIGGERHGSEGYFIQVWLSENNDCYALSLIK